MPFRDSFGRPRSYASMILRVGAVLRDPRPEFEAVAFGGAQEERLPSKGAASDGLCRHVLLARPSPDSSMNRPGIAGDRIP